VGGWGGRQTNREAPEGPLTQTQHLIPEDLKPELVHIIRCPEGTNYLLIIDSSSRCDDDDENGIEKGTANHNYNCTESILSYPPNLHMQSTVY
jgi:hypothetical protein